MFSKLWTFEMKYLYHRYYKFIRYNEEKIKKSHQVPFCIVFFLLPLHEFVQKGNDRHLALVLPSEFETLSVHCLASNRSRFIRVF